MPTASAARFKKKTTTRATTRNEKVQTLIQAVHDQMLPTAATKTERRNTFAWRLEESLKRANLTHAKLAKGLGCQRTTITNWKRGAAIPRIPVMAAAAKVINVALEMAGASGDLVTPEYLAYGTRATVEVVRTPEGLSTVPEVQFIGARADKRHTRRTWVLPTDWLRELGVLDPANVLIYKVEVDSAGYEFGDLVIVDTGVTRVQPAGAFLHWLGDGPAVSRISVLPSGDRKFVAKVEGTMGSVEAIVDHLQIVGRIRGMWRKA